MAFPVGSSRAADAEAARRRSEDLTDPRDKRENLLEELADSAEKRRAAGDEQGAALAAKAFDMLQRTLLMLEGKLASAPQQAVRSKRRPMRCPTCDQPVTVCNGKHVTLNVLPSQHRFWRHFQGVTLNGITYCGPSVVAESQASTIMSAVARWEEREQQLYIPGGKAFADMGDLGGKSRGIPVEGRTPIL